MTVYALRLENNTDTAPRMRFGDLLGLAPGSAPLTARSGVRPDGGGVVAVVTGQMQVTVTAFMAWIQGGVSVAQGGYTFVSDSTVTLAIAAGHASLSRTDTIAAVVRDQAYDTSGQTKAEVVVIAGTPGAGAPTLPSNAIALRDVTVPANLSAGNGGLQASNLGTDRRVYLGQDTTAARAWASTNTTLSTNGAGVVIALNNESYDDGNNFSGNTYTAPRTGRLEIDARASMSAAAAGDRFILSIYVNGTEALRGFDGTAERANPLGGMVSGTIQVAAGDQITLRGGGVTSTARITEAGSALCYLSCRML